MRPTTILSLFLAITFAALAVFATRTWLVSEREQIAAAARNTAQMEQPVTQTIVVAGAGLNFGERLTQDKLRTITWASDALPAGAFMTVEELVSTNEEEARFVIASMEPGEPVLRSKITEPGQRAKLSTTLTPGMKAISIRVNDVLGVAGFVLPGDRVDVMLTRTTRDKGAYVDVLLQGLRVLAIDQSADDRKDQPSVVRTVTFEVSTQEAQKLALGASVGTLSLALRQMRWLRNSQPGA